MAQPSQQPATTSRKTVMISSTARDLPEHRKEVLDACLRQGMFPSMMEHLPAIDSEAIDTSLKMVDEADIYLGVFAHRYGYIPAGHDISITEMEYNRAVERGIPRLIYLMHDDHPIKATEAYRLAWCDGPPFAYHWGLQKAKGHLSDLCAQEPVLPPFDESKFEPMPEVEIEPADEEKPEIDDE